MAALLLVAVSLGLSNFAASVGIGVTGIDARARLRAALIFGLFETAMPLIGLLLGHSLAHTLGHAAHWIGAGLLIATGLYALIQAVRDRGKPEADSQDGSADLPAGRMLITGLALSIDNLAVGFALGTYHVSVAVAAVVIGIVSVAMSLVGLELGSRVDTRAGDSGEIIGGIVLIGVGITIATGVI